MPQRLAKNVARSATSLVIATEEMPSSITTPEGRNGHLMNLDDILHPDSHLNVYLNKQHIESLQEEVNVLKLFLEGSQERGYDGEMMKKLERRIRDAALTAADFIDSHVYISNHKYDDDYLPKRNIGWKQISLIANQSFTHIIKEIKSVMLEVNKISDVPKTVKLQGLNSSEYLLRTILPSRSPPSQDCQNATNKLVGIDGHIQTLLHQLTQGSHRVVIPIVGMGGIGKTTLAERIYNDPLVIYHFYIRAWITIPQGHTTSVVYRVREMFLGLLKCFTKFTNEIDVKTNEELGDQIYKTLKDRKYLVVLDDMWQTLDWDILKMFLPDDKNGSRIILTSRLANIASNIRPSSSPHCMHFLKAAESWELLESKLFPKESCPPELVEIGKRIGIKCQGLPIAIVVVAGTLSKMEKTLESWTEIAENVESLVAKDPDQCINILALSYNYLPNYLKACFLYIGAFPRDNEIHVSRLIWLWIAEGFVQPIRGRCLEEVAEKHLEDLVNRNLVLVGKRRSNGRIKTCHIHDLLREFCLREALKEKFMYVIEQNVPSILVKSIVPRRISLHADILHFSACSIPLARTFLCYEVNKNLPHMFLLEVMDQIDFKLLRVLDIEFLRSNHFPIEIVQLIHLRYLALSTSCVLPGLIFKLQKLQTLVIDDPWGGQYLPMEILQMPHLRHIRFKRGCYFPLPCNGGIEENGNLVLQNLQTLSTVIGPVSCSKQLFACLPALRKLEIFATESNSEIEWSSECLSNLVCLNQLESLKCSFLYRPTMQRLPREDRFPASLKKLTLSGSYLPWDDMAILGKLPKLEVLKLGSFAFEGDEWIPVEGGFLQLKLLLMENSDPMTWDADETHFPKLHHLILKECYRLVEIPESIGDVPTLQIIEVHDCSYWVVDNHPYDAIATVLQFNNLELQEFREDSRLRAVSGPGEIEQLEGKTLNYLRIGAINLRHTISQLKHNRSMKIKSSQLSLSGNDRVSLMKCKQKMIPRRLQSATKGTAKIKASRRESNGYCSAHFVNSAAEYEPVGKGHLAR
ncbi:hypothetical protein BUALT_Bualt10G0020100 [Buddleja alternifolia]|uniref:NB-ARC domain-containing protein n=1 Tax=Buddleja alternifolia TaxID=168488 RepID=A0AAV6X6A0_9LAMI|nr:hypothetical protein BUALT_Bualt10G0020100 [Buddleja alternifolia]